MKKLLLLAAAIATSVTTASAIPLTYTIGTGSDVDANETDPGLVIQTALAPSLAGTSFVLDDGDAKSFAFFKIWTNEGALNNDDRAEFAISATLDFLVPDVDAVITGVTFSGRVLGFAGGKVEWDGPAIVSVLDRTFLVCLSDEIFNVGFWDFTSGPCAGATVTARVTQRTSTTVPDGGATLALLGLGLVGLVGLRRKLA